MQTEAVGLAALACILILGVPHGALDGEIARTRLWPAFGRMWFPVFAVPYLGLATGVLIAWRLSPEATLAAFLAASVWHFGEEDAPIMGGAVPGARRLMAIIALGGMSIAVPVLLHPVATARFLGIVSLQPMVALPGWLVLASFVWCPVALCWTVDAAWRRHWPSLTNAAFATCLFVVLPPLPAFAFYFVGLHAPRHMTAVIRQHRAARVRSIRDAIRYAAPITALTFLIGAALWRVFPGPPLDRLLALTIQGLSALTLPHMLLDIIVSQPRALRVAPVRDAGNWHGVTAP